MLTLGIALLVAFMASLLAIKLIKPFAFRVGLVDIPNHRKLHNGEIPLIGGIAVFIGVLTSSAVLYPSSSVLNLYLISSALIVFIGVLDDYKDLTVSFRLVAQILISCIMVYGAGLHIGSFGNLLSLGEVVLGLVGYPITILAVIAAINAFNMSDGIDGLAGYLSLVSFLSLAFLMVSSHNQYSYLPLLLAFSTIPYLLFNLGYAGGQAKKIFMGDAGSMFVGLSIVWLLVIGSQGEHAAFRPVAALWIIAVPFWDMCSLTIRRIRRGRSPFMPDRDHLHHICLNLGMSSQRALLLIGCFATLMATVGIMMEYFRFPEYIMFGLYLAIFAIYHNVLGQIGDKEPAAA